MLGNTEDSSRRIVATACCAADAVSCDGGGGRRDAKCGSESTPILGSATRPVASDARGNPAMFAPCGAVIQTVVLMVGSEIIAAILSAVRAACEILGMGVAIPVMMCVADVGASGMRGEV